MAINESNNTVHTAGLAVEALFNAGTIVLYTGTQPATADTALSGNTVLVTLTFGNPAFGTDTNGVSSATAITSGVAVATGTATFFRVFKSDATTVIMDGTVGTSASDLNLATTSIVTGGTVSISSFQYTQTK